MRKVTTILCSIAFMISGIMMAITVSNSSNSPTGYSTMNATTRPTIYTPEVPMLQCDTDLLYVPEDFVRDLAKRKGLLDTVYVTKTDTIKEEVTKVKWRQAPVPEPVIVRDTIREAHYYIATQVGMKEGPKDQCIPIYEVHKVDEICPKITNSSVQPITELDNDVGE